MKRIGNATSFLFLFFLSGFLSIPGWSDSAPTVTATVDRNQMGVGDTFTLTISISSSDSVSSSEPSLVNMDDFDVLNTWKGSESRSTFVNGKFSVERSINFNYQLAPKKAGNLEISSVEVKVDGKSFNTKPITLQVSNTSPPQNQARRRGQPQADPNGLPPDLFEEDDLFTQLLRRRMNPGLRTQPSNPNEAFFIQVELDKTKAYVGEQITATWFLYTKDNIRDLDTLKYPSLKGFWKEDLEISTRLNFTAEVVNGVPYRKALLASYALFPIKAGVAVVDPYKAKATFINPFGFGLGQATTGVRASQPVKIEVADLPTADRPKDFSGAVGEFDLSAKLDAAEVPAHQPLTLTVRFEGRGNAKVIDLPPLDLPKAFELYDTKTETKFLPTGASYKEFKVFLIPREAGDFSLPPVSASIFDPKTKRYYSKVSPAFSVKVTPSATTPQAGKDFLKKRTEETEVEDNGPRIIETYSQSLAIPSGVRWGGVGVIGIGLLVALGFKWRTEFGRASLKKELSIEVRDRLNKVRALLDKGEYRKLGAESSQLIYFVLRKIVDNYENEVHYSQLMNQTPPSFKRKVGNGLNTLMTDFQTLGFAPDSVVQQISDKKALKKKVDELAKILDLAVDAAGMSTDEQTSA